MEERNFNLFYSNKDGQFVISQKNEFSDYELITSGQTKAHCNKFIILFEGNFLRDYRDVYGLPSGHYVKSIYDSIM